MDFRLRKITIWYRKYFSNGVLEVGETQSGLMRDSEWTHARLTLYLRECDALCILQNFNCLADNEIAYGRFKRFTIGICHMSIPCCATTPDFPKMKLVVVSIFGEDLDGIAATFSANYRNMVGEHGYVFVKALRSYIDRYKEMNFAHGRTLYDNYLLLANFFADVTAASNIFTVSLPVNVFCWLG